MSRIESERLQARFTKALQAGKDVMQRGILSRVEDATRYVSDLYGLTYAQEKRLDEALRRFREDES